MKLLLGPVPASIRETVMHLVAENARNSQNKDERLNGLLLTGGPCGGYYLNANGDVWNWWWTPDGDEGIDLVPDGPVKVSIIAVAAKNIPLLSKWLPIRPDDAMNCQVCNGTGKLPQFPNVSCPTCFALGWLYQLE